MRRIGWTTEDQAVLVRAARSTTSLDILARMVNDDDTDMHIMYDRVEIAACDAWSNAEAAYQDALDQERWDNEIYCSNCSDGGCSKCGYDDDLS